MSWIHSISCISICILLLQSSVSGAPYTATRALLKRDGQLHGRFLHITDIHLDDFYLEGSDPATLCHRRGLKDSEEVGRFGALGTRCDSPISLVDASFEFLKKNVQDVDFILYTGDTARHDRDDDMPITDKEILDGHKKIMKYFDDAYDTKHTPYIPTIGNNDGLKHNDIVKDDKIFSQLETIWEPLSLNLTSEFTEGGYFTQDVIENKLTVINTNSMYFYKKGNKNTECDGTGSTGDVHIAWLEDTLRHYAEKDSSHLVYIMGHVPPVDDDGSKLYKKKCFKKYIQLLGKYSEIIAGHFTGHTNRDNLNAVVKEGDDYTVINAGKKNTVKDESAVGLFNAPSIIPKYNPAVRVYDYETGKGKNPVGTILDWKQYYVDLKKANEIGKVEFEVEYVASELFGVKTFDNKGIANAMNQIAEDKKVRKLYKKYSKVSTK